MSLLCVEGRYQDGKIELIEQPNGVGDSARVIVTFLPAQGAQDQAQAAPSSEEQARIEAGRRLMARLKEGIPFGGSPYPKREEIYDRTYRFDGTRTG